MRAWLRKLLCWLGFHDWETAAYKVLFLGARKGHGKNREVRAWKAVGGHRIGCYHCDWKPAEADPPDLFDPVE